MELGALVYGDFDGSHKKGMAALRFLSIMAIVMADLIS